MDQVIADQARTTPTSLPGRTAERTRRRNLLRLLENAEQSPEQPASLFKLDPTGDVMLEVEDSGIGMTPEQLDDSNERLANPPVVDVAISSRMGLFVVGRLAARRAIQVRLRRSATGGVTTLVLIPAALRETSRDDRPGRPRSGLESQG